MRPVGCRRGGAFRPGICSSDLGMSCGYCIGGAVERGAADEFPTDPMARAGPGGLAADLRYRGTGRAFVPHRRTGKSLCLPVAWSGPDLGDRAAAANDLAD